MSHNVGFKLTSAELILISSERLYGKNCENGVNEYQEGQDITKTWQRCHQRLDLLLHQWNRVNRSQRSENSECTKGFQTTTVHVWNKVDDGNAHDKKIKPVPDISEVTVSVPDKSHACNFKHALTDENRSKGQVNVAKLQVYHRHVVNSVDAIVVVCHCKHNRVGQDDKGNKVIKPPPLNEPDKCLSKKKGLIQNEQTASVIQNFSTVNLELARAFILVSLHLFYELFVLLKLLYGGSKIC